MDGGMPDNSRRDAPIQIIGVNASRETSGYRGEAKRRQAPVPQTRPKSLILGVRWTPPESKSRTAALHKGRAQPR